MPVFHYVGRGGGGRRPDGAPRDRDSAGLVLPGRLFRPEAGNRLRVVPAGQAQPGDIECPDIERGRTRIVVPDTDQRSIRALDLARAAFTGGPLYRRVGV